MIKMTRPRQLVLDMLRNPPDGDDCKTLSASTISFYFKHAKPPVTLHPKAVHRALRELWEAGLVVAHREKTNGDMGILPCWKLYFELAEESMTNYRRERIIRLESFIRRRTAGLDFFGKTFVEDWKPGDREHVRRELESLKFGGTDDLGDLLAWEAQEQIVTAGSNVIELRKIIQANHPDRPRGNPEVARMAIEALKRQKQAS